MSLTPEQLESAQAMRDVYKSSWELVADRFGVTVYYLRGCLDPAWKSYRIKKTNECRARMRERKENPGTSCITHHVVQSMNCPGDILAERDRRLGIPHPDFTSQFMGDPLPGYSALDKKQRAFG